MRWTHAVACTLCLTLAGCGGGGGSDGGGGQRYSITLSPTSLAFDGSQGVTTASKTVTATFNGDGVVVGTLPGQPSLPSWLSIGANSQGPSPVGFTVSVDSGAAPGDYQTTLRFLTGKADGSAVVSTDLPISFHQRESFNLTTYGLQYEGLAGSGSVRYIGTTVFAITGENVAWTAETTEPWIQLGATSGNARGPVAVIIDANALSAGYHNGEIRVRDSISGRDRFAIVQVQIREPLLTLEPASLSFTVDAQTVESQTQATLHIGDELMGANPAHAYSWTLSPVNPLVNVSVGSGTTVGGGTTVTVSLDEAVLNGQPSGTLQTALDFRFTAATGGGSTSPHYIPLTVTVRLPRANSTDPYVVTPGVAGHVTLVGDDFRDEDLPRLRIGGNPPAQATRLTAKTIDLQFDPLLEGPHFITFENALGLWRSAAEINALPAATVSGGEILSSGAKTRLLFDAPRRTLYAVDTVGNEIERYQWNGTLWATRNPVPLTEVRDIAFARNGREMYASSPQGMYGFDMSRANPTPSLLTDTMANCTGGGTLRSIAAPENGTIIGGIVGNSCAIGPGPLGIDEYTATLEFDWPSDQLRPWRFPTTGYFYSFHSPNLATSGDGRYLAAGDRESTGSYGLLDERTGEWVHFGYASEFFNVSAYTALDIDHRGTKVLANHTEVRQTTAIPALACRIPFNRIARLSRTGTRVYVYEHADGGAGLIRVYDATVSLGTNTCPEVSTFPVPHDMGDSPANEPGNFAMTVSDDGQWLFLSGTSRIAIVAVPPAAQ